MYVPDDPRRQPRIVWLPATLLLVLCGFTLGCWGVCAHAVVPNNPIASNEYINFAFFIRPPACRRSMAKLKGRWSAWIQAGTLLVAVARLLATIWRLRRLPPASIVRSREPCYCGGSVLSSAFSFALFS